MFEVSPSMENVNVYCNPGFYQQVGRPAFCTLDKGFTFKIADINFSYSEITPGVDLAGIEQTLLVKFSFILGGSPGVVTIHLHHTKQKIQVQGSTLMPDQNSAAVWFVLNGMYERFLKMSKNNQHHIQAYNRALLTLSKDQQPETTNKDICGHYKKTYTARSKPAPCLTVTICKCTVI